MGTYGLYRKMKAMLVAAAAEEPPSSYRADATVHAVKHAAMPSAPKMNILLLGYRGAIIDKGTLLIKLQQLCERMICCIVRLFRTPTIRRTFAK